MLYAQVNKSSRQRSYLNDAYYQTVTFKKDSSIQPSLTGVGFCYGLFNSYRVVNIDAGTDGYSYLHGSNHSRRKYRVPNGFQGLMNELQKGNLKSGVDVWGVDNSQIYITDKSEQYITVRAMWHDPAEVLTWDATTSAYVNSYNSDTDPFLCTGDLYSIMCELFKQRNGMAVQTMPSTTDYSNTPQNAAAANQRP